MKIKYEKPKFTPPTEIIIDIKEYERLLGIGKAWKRLREFFNPYVEVPGVRYRAREVLEEMTLILKQCTKKKKKGEG